jgi:hypothetical protein
VTESDWAKLDRERHRKDSLGERGNFDRDRLGRREDGREDGTRPVDLSDPNAEHEPLPGAHKDKFTHAQIERRAEFERLLNSTGIPNTRKPNSLEPVTSIDMARPDFATPALPPVGGPPLNNGPVSPDAAFNARQDYLRGPTEEASRKYSTPPKKPAAYDPSAKTPLMRQPTVHEIPSRQF